jgi:surface antigen Omp85-like protein
MPVPRMLVQLALITLLIAAPLRAQDPPTAPEPKTPPAPTGKPGGTQLPQPPMPEKMKAMRARFENHPLVQHLIHDDDGVYPRGFSIWTGAGISGGLGYRRHIWDGRAIAGVSGELSIRGYRVVESSLELETLPRRLFLRGDARYRHFPQEDFFGVGGNSRMPQRSTYLLRTGELWGTFGARVAEMTAGVELGWLGVDVGPGTDDRFPTVGALFTESTVPGLSEQPNYIRTGAFWTLERVDEPGYPRRGTRHRVTFNDYRDVSFARYSFKRFDAETAAFVPVMRDRDVIAMRARVTYANNKPGHIVPFYMLPTLGGGNSLRAFDEFRYRDENALLLNAEYRIGAHDLVDVAIFGDAGKVAHDYQDINPKGLIADYGAGVRFHTATRTLFRFDVARGREGMRYLFKMTRAF